MTTSSQTFGIDGAFTASPYLLNAAVTVDVRGAEGVDNGYGHLGGKGGRVTGNVPTSASASLNIKVGHKGVTAFGYAQPGAGGTASAFPGAAGGGASGVENGTTPLVVAGGGGGGGGGDGGIGGPGGYAGNGTPGHNVDPGLEGVGAILNNPGAGGASPVASPGSAGSSGGTGGAGGNSISTQNSGGGGGGGYAGGGGGGGGWAFGGSYGGGGGGGGGSSFADISVSSVSEISGVQIGNGLVIVTQTYADAPLSPTLVSPSNLSTAELQTAGPTFSFNYNKGTDSGSLNAWAIRRMAVGGSAYEYYSTASGLWGSSPVWNPIGVLTNVGSKWSYTFPTSKWTDGTSYVWSVACQESHYALDGPFASDFVVTAQAMPILTVTAPVATTSTITPNIAWTETLAGGATQALFRVIGYTAAEAAAPGFIPGQPPDIYDSGVISSAATSFTVPIGAGLQNGSSYVFYVQITDNFAVSSAWTSASFTVNFGSPATPTLVSVAGTDITGLPIVTNYLATSDNILSSDDASFETSLGSWIPSAGVSATRESSWAVNGSWGMALENTGTTGTISATTGVSAVAPGQAYSAMATFHAETTGRTCSLVIEWFDASMTPISSSTIGSTSDASASTVTGTVTSPAGAAFADVKVSIAAVPTNEVHDIDEVGFFYGTVATWSPGGFVGASIAEFQRSDDGGTTWADVTGGSAVAVAILPETAQVIDHGAPHNTSLEYRARVLSSVNQQIASSWSSVQILSLGVASWWILDPLDPSTALPLRRIASSNASPVNGTGSIEFDRTDVQGVYRPLGRTTAVVEHGDLWAEEFDLSLIFLDTASWQAFDALRSKQITLLLKSDMDGAVYYVSLGADRPAVVLRASDRTTSPMREVTVHCTPVDAP